MQPQTKKQYLKRLVSEKNDWSRPLTDERAKARLPRLARARLLAALRFSQPRSVRDIPSVRLTMPSSRRAEWEYLLKIEDGKDRRKQTVEEYLDRGVGNCELRDPRIAQVTEDALLHFHQQRYELFGMVHYAKSRPCFASHLVDPSLEDNSRLENPRNHPVATSAQERRAPARPVLATRILGYLYARRRTATESNQIHRS